MKKIPDFEKRLQKNIEISEQKLEKQLRKVHDFEKIRRRCRDALNKTDKVFELLDVAKILGVKIK